MENLNAKEVPLVSVRCLTYNQKKYIKDALDGFVKQITDFSFEVIVHDDASTDGTAAIVKEYAEKYPDIIKPIFETENQYSKHDGSLRRIMNEACKGKYIAYCEGDDYWTDPYKLQKQVSFLEKHPDYSMCCTNVRILSPSGFIQWKRFNETCDIFPNMMIKGGGSLIATCTQVYRKEVFNVFSYLDFCMKCYIGDYTMQILSSLMGKVHYIHEETSVYRYCSDGSWTSNSNGQPILMQLPDWKSQIVMLKGLDNFSKGIYHIDFYEAQIELVDWICRNNIGEYKKILDEFKDVLRMPFIYKFTYHIIKDDYKFLYPMCIFLKRCYNSVCRNLCIK